MKFDLIIVGAGLFGLTIAERTANILNKKVLILEKRNHIGGNAYSYFDNETGIEVHKYGSHIFHTSNKHVWKYVNKFTEFTQYNHKVYTIYDNEVYSMPINLLTINNFYKKSYTPSEARNLIASQSCTLKNKKLTNLRDKSIASIGYDLYKAFIEGYTKKQWNLNPFYLPAETIKRLPIRFNYDNKYFDDLYQGMPKNGYENWFTQMIDNSNIKIQLNEDFFSIKSNIKNNIPIVYTGPLDKYFDFVYGNLTWRSLSFKKIILDISDFQGTSVMNYSNENIKYTRIHEFKHFHPYKKYLSKKTIIVKEFPKSISSNNDEPFYPVNSASDRIKLLKYRSLMNKEKNIFFGGRLGTYQYLDMHMAIGSALNMFNNHIIDYFNNKKK